MIIVFNLTTSSSSHYDLSNLQPPPLPTHTFTVLPDTMRIDFHLMTSFHLANLLISKLCPPMKWLTYHMMAGQWINWLWHQQNNKHQNHQYIKFCVYCPDANVAKIYSFDQYMAFDIQIEFNQEAEKTLQCSEAIFLELSHLQSFGNLFECNSINF